MTIYTVSAVRDSALQAYGNPMFSPTAAAMVRSFTDEVNRRGQDASPMSQHPDDYELVELGTFNNETGEFHNQPRLLVRAKDVVKE